MTIARIVQTCSSHPSQWEGYLADGRAFYIRYRHGHLSMVAHLADPFADDAVSLFDDVSAGGGGDMPYDELRGRLTRHGIGSPERMDAETEWHEGIVPALRLDR